MTFVEKEKAPKSLHRSTEWRRKNREKANAYMRSWWARQRDQNPEKVKAGQRESRLKMKYGITHEQYEAMLAAQGGRCALCDKTPDQERFKVFHVDHCHDTGKVRGLLCNHHNLAIGYLGDTEEALARALAYLKGEK